MSATCYAYRTDWGRGGGAEERTRYTCTRTCGHHPSSATSNASLFTSHPGPTDGVADQRDGISAGWQTSKVAGQHGLSAVLPTTQGCRVASCLSPPLSLSPSLAMATWPDFRPRPGKPAGTNPKPGLRLLPFLAPRGACAEQRDPVTGRACARQEPASRRPHRREAAQRVCHVRGLPPKSPPARRPPPLDANGMRGASPPSPRRQASGASVGHGAGTLRAEKLEARAVTPSRSGASGAYGMKVGRAATSTRMRRRRSRPRRVFKPACRLPRTPAQAPSKIKKGNQGKGKLVRGPRMHAKTDG